MHECRVATGCWKARAQISLLTRGELPQPLEPYQLVVESRIARIQPAGVRQHKYSRAMYLLLLCARAVALRDMKKSAVDADAYECNHARLYSSNLARERLSSRDHLTIGQLRRRPCRARTKIRQRQIELDPPRVVLARE